jgi:phage terminase small subunit
MPRNRLTLKQAELSGSLRHDKKRFKDRMNEPAANGELGEPPERFDHELAAIWHQMAADAPVGVLTAADRTLLEVLCVLLQKFRADKHTNIELGHLIGCLGRLGLTPTDRTKIGVSTKKQEEQQGLAALARDCGRVQ